MADNQTNDDPDELTETELASAVQDTYRFYESQISTYAKMRTQIIRIATDDDNPDCWREGEPEIDQLAEKLNRRPPLSKQANAAVYWFLVDLHLDRETDLVCGGVTGPCAAVVVQRAMLYAHKVWLSNRIWAENERILCEFDYEIPASELFYKRVFKRVAPEEQDDAPPGPLRDLLRMEHALARRALKKRIASAPAPLPEPACAGAECVSDASGDSPPQSWRSIGWVIQETRELRADKLSRYMVQKLCREAKTNGLVCKLNGKQWEIVIESLAEIATTQRDALLTALRNQKR